MSDLEVLKKMLGRVKTTHFSDWALRENVYGDAARTMSIGCPDGQGAGASLSFDKEGKLLEFKVFESDGYRCKCEHCKPFHSGSDSCGCDHVPCDHDKFVDPSRKVFVPTEFFSLKTGAVDPKVIESFKKSFKKAIKKSTKKRSRK